MEIWKFTVVLTFDLLLPGAPGEEDQQWEELPEGDASPPAAAHQQEDLLTQAAGDTLPQHRGQECLSNKRANKNAGRTGLTNQWRRGSEVLSNQRKRGSGG